MPFIKRPELRQWCFICQKATLSRRNRWGHWVCVECDPEDERD
jgi:hypothetical protein